MGEGCQDGVGRKGAGTVRECTLGSDSEADDPYTHSFKNIY